MQLISFWKKLKFKLIWLNLHNVLLWSTLTNHSARLHQVWRWGNDINLKIWLNLSYSSFVYLCLSCLLSWLLIMIFFFIHVALLALSLYMSFFFFFCERLTIFLVERRRNLSRMRKEVSMFLAREIQSLMELKSTVRQRDLIRFPTPHSEGGNFCALARKEIVLVVFFSTFCQMNLNFIRCGLRGRK